MRDVFDALERLGVRYFVTDSVAASVHGVLRQTHDTDVVVDLTAAGFRQLAQAIGTGFQRPEPFEGQER